MISYEIARQTILDKIKCLEPVSEKFSDVLGCVLAEDVTAQFDMPLFDNSAMDGYGVCAVDLENASEDSPVTMPVQRVIQAGEFMENSLDTHHVVQIFTGAPIPLGVDAVVMKEHCTRLGDKVMFTRPIETGKNIRRRGEEFQHGVVAVEKDTVINPATIGLLATLGYNAVPVYRRPSVSLLITGNELVQPGETLSPGQIYESNSHALRAVLNSMGLANPKVFYAKDDEDSTKEAFHNAIPDSDVIISLGGISVGDFDVVKDVYESSGVETLFWRIAMKPGKPVYFGRLESAHRTRWIVGLPGNPVSALVTFHQLVQPALEKMMGRYVEPKPFKAKLNKSLKKKPGRMEFVRGVATPDGQVTVTSGQQSHMLGGLSQANCLIRFPEDLENLNVGDNVDIEPLNWV